MATKIERDKSDHDLARSSNLFDNMQNIAEIRIDISLSSLDLLKTNLSDIIVKIDNMEDFIVYLQKNDFSIYLPDANFNTVFHTLLGSHRYDDLKFLADFIQNNRESEIVKFRKQIAETFAIVMGYDECELDYDEISSIYSELRETVFGDVSFEEEVFMYNGNNEIKSSIIFIEKELKKILDLILEENIFINHND